MSDLHFDVHPSVIFQLGEDLISDDVQALFELVKNCYDANASYALIEINTNEGPQATLKDTLFTDAKGYIKIQDDGAGMSMEGIERGWLVVSNSAKRRIKREGKVPPGSRTPLGDKGLGRLGAQRIARNLEIITSTGDEKVERHVGFSWEAFAGREALRDVPVLGPRTRTLKEKRHGTIVLLSGLNEPERWKGPSVKTDLEERFAELISPFEGIKSFDLIVSVDGVKIDPARVAKNVRKEADSTFTLHFDGKQLRFTGRFKLRLLEPQGEPRKRIFHERCKEDGGAALLSALVDGAKDRFVRLGRAPSTSWFLQIDQAIRFDEIDKLELDENGEVGNPGPFHGEVDSFDLGRSSGQTAFSKVDELRKFVKGLAAVRVYRDGFGVRVGDDFLKLGKAWTSGSSWYGLKPANTIGFVAISARDNPDLQETTDREGFKRTPHYRNFELLLERFVKFTQESLEYVRRETISYCDRFVEEDAELTPQMGPEEIGQRIGEHLLETRKIEDKLPALRRRMESSRQEAEKAAHLAGDSLFAPTKESVQVQKAILRVKDAVEQTEQAIGEVEALLVQAPKIQASLAVLQNQIERFNERLSQAYETMSLGITAEALIHEITYIADGLGERLAEIKNYLKAASLPDQKIRAFIRHVESTISALRKQLGHLDPALRYARERRDVIDLRSFLVEVEDFHRSRWRKGDLSIKVENLSHDPFNVRINRGKLTQIFDNLIINGEYWLREDIRRKRVSEGIIKIELRAPKVWVSDNGRGIDPSVEGTLFEPFVTTRKKGRGLGLFIVTEFMRSEGGSIELYSERNEAGRLYAFELDFSGMMGEEEDE